ncbi:hypothetical protein EDD17DRAFT_1514724 [Pisolithus thermaeus]|nr:hypothetical protein EDD17DRAFT_1514724 [Pisolithus thermaeus]
MRHASDNSNISSSILHPAVQLPSATENPSLISSDNHTSVFIPCPLDPSVTLASTNQLPDVVVNAPSSSLHNQVSLCIPSTVIGLSSTKGLNDSASATTSQLPNMSLSATSSSGAQAEPDLPGHQPLFVPPPLARHQCPPHMKGLYLPAPLPVFTLPGCQHLAQDPKATPHYHRHPPTHKPDTFDHMNEFQFNDEAGPPSGRSALQKREIQWQQWSQDIIPALLNPYLQYLQVSESLWVVVDSTVDH